MMTDLSYLLYHVVWFAHRLLLCSLFAIIAHCSLLFGLRCSMRLLGREAISSRPAVKSLATFSTLSRQQIVLLLVKIDDFWTAVKSLATLNKPNIEYNRNRHPVRNFRGNASIVNDRQQ